MAARAVIFSPAAAPRARQALRCDIRARTPQRMHAGAAILNRTAAAAGHIITQTTTNKQKAKLYSTVLGLHVGPFLSEPCVFLVLHGGPRRGDAAAAATRGGPAASGLLGPG